MSPFVSPFQATSLDADGVSTREELLRRWEQEELLVLPSIECIDDDKWLEEEIALLPRASAWVTNLLEENLGPFSLHWLKDETQENHEEVIDTSSLAIS